MRGLQGLCCAINDVDFSGHFPDDIFKDFFLNENVSIVIRISLKFVPKGPINNIPALVQIMAWHCPGDKPLSEAMMVSLPMHICVTRPQWVNAWLNILCGVNLRKHICISIISWLCTAYLIIIANKFLQILFSLLFCGIRFDVFDGNVTEVYSKRVNSTNWFRLWLCDINWLPPALMIWCMHH